MMARRIATMGQSELDGVSDGEWAVFAEKVVEERDASVFFDDELFVVSCKHCDAIRKWKDDDDE
jgi:hypothetical protein